MIMIAFCLTMFPVSTAGQCTDSLLLPSIMSVETCGLDTSNHWWAIIRPYIGAQRLVVDGAEFGTWDSVFVPVFANDGSTWAAKAVRSSQWSIIRPDTSHLMTSTIMQLFFPTNDTTLWWTEQISATYRITNGRRSYSTNNPILNIAIDPQGLWVAWQEERSGQYLVIRNGTEVARNTNLTLHGVWAGGQCLYSVQQGQQTEMMLDSDVLQSGMRNLYTVQLNPARSVVAWQASDAIGQVHTYLYTDEYVSPWEGPIVSTPDPQMAISPLDPLVAYRTVRQGSRVVGYNAAFYPGGTVSSPPSFSHDGSQMVYACKENADYVVVNGKRIQVKAGVPTTDVLAVSPTGHSVAWCSPTTLVTVDLEFNKLTTGRMCDSMNMVIYNRKLRAFQALGTMSGRLYMLTCPAR